MLNSYEERSMSTSVRADLSAQLNRVPHQVAATINMVQQAENNVSIALQSPINDDLFEFKVFVPSFNIELNSVDLYSCAINSSSFNGILFFPQGIIDTLSDFLLPGWSVETSDIFALDFRNKYIIGELIRVVGFDAATVSIASPRKTEFIPEKYRISQFYLATDFNGKLDPLIIGIDSVDSDAFKKYFDKSGPSQLVSDIPIQTKIRLSRTILKCEVEQLNTGDVVIFVAAADDIVPVYGQVGTFLSVMGQLDLSAEPHIKVLDATWEPQPSKAQKNAKNLFGLKDTAINKKDNLSGSDGSSEHPSPLSEIGHAHYDDIATSNHQENSLIETLRDVPVSIDLTFASTSMTFEKASSLTIGSIIETDLNLSDPIDISVNGHILGQGYLIKVGGSIGVQIASWNARKLNNNAK